MSINIRDKNQRPPSGVTVMVRYDWQRKDFFFPAMLLEYKKPRNGFRWTCTDGVRLKDQYVEKWIDADSVDLVTPKIFIQ